MSTFASIPDKNTFYMNLFLCGMSFYLYNEMQNLVLGSLGPVPTGKFLPKKIFLHVNITIYLAVGNTLKRVVIFVALYYFTSGETFPLPKVLGCAIAIVGCLLFAVFDSKKL